MKTLSLSFCPQGQGQRRWCYWINYWRKFIITPYIAFRNFEIYVTCRVGMKLNKALSGMYHHIKYWLNASKFNENMRPEKLQWVTVSGYYGINFASVLCKASFITSGITNLRNVMYSHFLIYNVAFYRIGKLYLI